MITILSRRPAIGPAHDQLVLPFDLRQKSRLRARLQSGRDVALILERGGILRGGDRLSGSDGTVIDIVAADETVTEIVSDDALLLTRAAYHLGNRHVPLAIGPGWLRMLQDSVLEDMVRGLGLEVRTGRMPFDPEAGAYAGGGHHHGDGPGRIHDSGAVEDHDHDHDHHDHHGHHHHHAHD